MGKRSEITTKEALISQALPTYTGDSYTVIPHNLIIDETVKNLSKEGFVIKNELYKANKDGNIAQGIYHLDYNNDPDMGLMFAWGNSYNKSMRFKCAIGAYVFVCSNGVISGDMSSWSRKHTGSAHTDTIETLETQISKAKEHYATLVYEKECMKKIIISDKDKAQLIGRLYFEEDLLTSEQLSIIKNQMLAPSHNYNADKDSTWSLYNHITMSLNKSHPKNWIDDQKAVHSFFKKEYAINALPIVDVNQLLLPILD